MTRTRTVRVPRRSVTRARLVRPQLGLANHFSD
jgi:hypothetical protein